ncbi:hypothetical protein KI387_023582, partial [Taxus chinensis]
DTSPTSRGHVILKITVGTLNIFMHFSIRYEVTHCDTVLGLPLLKIKTVKEAITLKHTCSHPSYSNSFHRKHSQHTVEVIASILGAWNSMRIVPQVCIGGDKMHKDQILKLAKGFRGRAKNCIRIARERVEKALQYSYRDRRNKKRDMRGLWIQRINAGTRLYGIVDMVTKRICLAEGHSQVLGSIACSLFGTFKNLNVVPSFPPLMNMVSDPDSTGFSGVPRQFFRLSDFKLRDFRNLQTCGVSQVM